VGYHGGMNMPPSHSSVSRLRQVAGALFATAIVATTFAAQPAVRTEERVVITKPAIKRADRDFMEKAAKAGMEEVQISRVAAERTTNPDVKRLAQMIVADHTDANEELAALAAAKGVALPAKDHVFEEKWAKHKAADFDRDYLDKMVNAHEDAVKLFEREAKNGEDAEAVAFARKRLTGLQHHLQQAIDLKRVLK
jgi:putative membrane protein